MAFNLDRFRANFGALMAQIRGNLNELDRARDEMRHKIETFCAH